MSTDATTALGNAGVTSPASRARACDQGEGEPGAHGHGDARSRSVALALSAVLGEADGLAQLDAPDDTDVRWAVHRSMWRASPLKKVRACRRWAHDHDTGTVPLVGAPTGDGGLSIGFGNLKTCACWHSCLICGVKLAVQRAKELEHALRIWEALGGRVLVATFSARHHKGMTLREQIGAQRTAWASVQKSRAWKRDAEKLGLRFTIKAFEATYGDEHGWHPHLHVYMFCDPRWLPVRETTTYTDKRGRTRTRSGRPVWTPPWEVHGVHPREIDPCLPLSQESAEAMLAPIWARWCDGLASVGMSAIDYVMRPGGMRETAGFDVTIMDVSNGADSLARYPFKLALEAVGAVFKHGRGEPGHRHRTPFEVMESYAVALHEDDQDGAADDLRIITEWSTTANDMRLRQAPWPPGMRAWMTRHAELLELDGPLLERELTDEEVAEAHMEGAQTLADIPEDAYTQTVVWELDTLRAAARHGGWQAVQLWFDMRGIPLELRDDCPLTDPDRAPGDRSVPACAEQDMA